MSEIAHKIITSADGAIVENDACTHGVSYDKQAAAGLPSSEVRKRWPRLSGACPKGCGYSGIYYASFEHYMMGDW